MDPVIEYVIALTNLYGIVHKDKVLEIYNQQNNEPESIRRVEALIEDPPAEMETHNVHLHKNYLVLKTIYDHDEFDSVLQEKAGKPYYVPEKEELLLYVDEMHIERTNAYDALLTYFKENLFEPGDPKAEWLADDIQGMCQHGANLEYLFESFQQRGITLKDVSQVNEVMQRIMALTNSTRIWENNGHPPNEIHELMEKPRLRLLSDAPVWEEMGMKG